ncbi:hypothetical protein FOA52_010489 [Chlamydomonas sp. UWO 241]|nr:hypothetical protein FOA52_010489 [Chlamydomonas sp. UWO 241]
MKGQKALPQTTGSGASWDLQAVVQVVWHTGICLALWRTALSSRRGTAKRSHAPTDYSDEAFGGSDVTAPDPATTATGASTSPATPTQDAVGGGGLPIYRSVVAGIVNASAVTFVTKFPSLHLAQHPQLSTPLGVAALQGRLECRASEVLSCMRGERVETCLAQLSIAAGCIVIAGRWIVQGAGSMSEQEMRALVEDVLLEEMLQEVDPAPEGMRTPCCILDSSSDMWGLDLDDADESQPAPMLHVETGAHTGPQAHTHGAPPSMAGVPLLAVTMPLQALPLHDGGHSCVLMQFATPLLARALGRDPELVVSFASAGGADAPAPHASLLRVRVDDLQAAARARGNPPDLMDVEIDLTRAGAAHAYGGMLIAQLVDGPIMLAAVPVPLLPCAARPAVAELSRLGLDPCTASNIACDLGLLLLAPHPTDELPHARRALMRNAALQLAQWTQNAHLPATLTLLDSALAQLDAADASPPPPPRMPGAAPIARAAQGGAGGAPADRE